MDHLQLRRDHVDQFTDILAHYAQITAAVRAVVAGVEFAAFTRRVLGYLRTAALPGLGCCSGLFFGVRLVVAVKRRIICLGQSYLKVFQRQFELFDLAFDPFRARPEPLFLKFGDAHTQRLDQQIMGAQGGRDLPVFRLQGSDHRLQKSGIIRQWRGNIGHGRGYHARRSGTTKTSDSRGINHPTRAGGAPQFGLRQSIPSQSIASCAEVRRTLPSVALGHGKRPFSSTL